MYKIVYSNNIFTVTLLKIQRIRVNYIGGKNSSSVTTLDLNFIMCTDSEGVQNLQEWIITNGIEFVKNCDQIVITKCSRYYKV